MSTGFDPLHQWLGIPPEEQPPHHYRLLGIALFESSPEVIESAADRQMVFLRTLYGGPFASYAQKLLNEVSAARVCLLNPQTKAQYDAWLRQQIAPPTPPAEPPLAFEPEAGGFQEIVGGPSDYRPPRHYGARKGQPWAAVAVLLAAILVGGGVLAFVFLKSKETVSREGTLVVQWPEDERMRGALVLDGRKLKLPLDGPIDYRVSVGTHQLAFSRPGYEPVRLLIEHHGSESVSQHYRAADVCVVTSLHDGMNLVAKEFVAAREDERGVLVLSQFTGAARELPEALIVNPYDVENVGNAIRAAIEMQSDERRARMATMRAAVERNSIYDWSAKLLRDLAEVRRRRVRTWSQSDVERRQVSNR